MNDADYRMARKAIMELAMAVADTGKHQQELVMAIDSIDRGSNKDNVKGMISVIYDGLAYGNWPWAEVYQRDSVIDPRD